MRWKNEYKNTFQTVYTASHKMRKPTNHREKKELEKKEKNKNKREIPNSLDKCPEFKSVEKG